MYSSTTTTKEQSISLLMRFRIFNFGKSKLYFVKMKTSKNCFIANAKTRYSNVIKTDNYFRTNCCFVINLKQNRFEILKNTI